MKVAGRSTPRQLWTGSEQVFGSCTDAACCLHRWSRAWLARKKAWCDKFWRILAHSTALRLQKWWRDCCAAAAPKAAQGAKFDDTASEKCALADGEAEEAGPGTEQAPAATEEPAGATEGEPMTKQVKGGLQRRRELNLVPKSGTCGTESDADGSSDEELLQQGQVPPRTRRICR